MIFILVLAIAVSWFMIGWNATVSHWTQRWDFTASDVTMGVFGGFAGPLAYIVNIMLEHPPDTLVLEGTKNLIRQCKDTGLEMDFSYVTNPEKDRVLIRCSNPYRVALSEGRIPGENFDPDYDGVETI